MADGSHAEPHGKKQEKKRPVKDGGKTGSCKARARVYAFFVARLDDGWDQGSMCYPPGNYAHRQSGADVGCPFSLLFENVTILGLIG